MKCCLCGKEIKGVGNNPPYPLSNYPSPQVRDLYSCDDCHYKCKVILERLGFPVQNDNEEG